MRKTGTLGYTGGNVPNYLGNVPSQDEKRPTNEAPSWYKKLVDKKKG
jgi:hypothetical protein